MRKCKVKNKEMRAKIPSRLVCNATDPNTKKNIVNVKQCVRVLVDSGFPNVPHDLSLTTWERVPFSMSPTPFTPTPALHGEVFSHGKYALSTSPRGPSFVRFSARRQKISSHAPFIAGRRPKKQEAIARDCEGTAPHQPVPLYV